MGEFTYDNLMHDVKSIDDINKLMARGVTLDDTDMLIDQLKFRARPSNAISIAISMFTLLITGIVNMFWHKTAQNKFIMDVLFIGILIVILILYFYIHNEYEERSKYNQQIEVLYAYKRQLMKYKK